VGVERRVGKEVEEEDLVELLILHISQRLVPVYRCCIR